MSHGGKPERTKKEDDMKKFYSQNVAGGDYKEHKTASYAARRACKEIGYFGTWGVVEGSDESAYDEERQVAEAVANGEMDWQND